MTQEEIFDLARESDLGFLLGDSWLMHFEIEAFAKLVAEKEREACAKICDEFCYGSTKILVEKAIRARGQA
jgi:hypothetical protein